MTTKKENIEKFSKRILLISFIFALIVGFYLRIAFYIDNRSFWLDEAFLGTNILSKSYFELFLPLDFDPVSPPLFSVVCKLFYDIFGGNQDLARGDYLLRLFPFLCSMASIPLFIFLCHKIFKNFYFTIFSSVFLLFNSAALRYAVEFKQYSTELFISLIAIYIFYSLLSDNISKKRIIAYSFFFALSFWFSNSVSFILFGGFLILLYKAFKDKNFRINFFIIFLPMCLSFLLFYFGYYKPISDKLYSFMSNYWLVKDPSFFGLNNFYDMFAFKTDELLPFVKMNLYPLFLLFGSLLLIASKKYKISILILLPIVLVIAASFMHFYPYEMRLIIFLIPSFIIICSQVFLYIKQNKYMTVFFSGIIIAISIFNLNYSIEARTYNQILIEKFYGMGTISKERLYARELTEFLYKKNPSFENVISCGMCFNYYSYVKTKRVFCTKEDLKDFTVENVKKQIKNTPKGQSSWLLFTDSNGQGAFLSLRDDLQKEYKNTQIWESPYYKGSYLLKITR